ncbi:alpha/beta hydrolase [Chlorogloeopsis fritschii PCC 9212]|uniref:alpha/beta hydrolase n=1 Tax=Chlorogloeopsis fritschii TaxID=1124 RepID=UPI0004750D99
MKSQLSRYRRQVYWLRGILCSLTVVCGWGMGMPSTLAAETVTIRLGPFQQSVAIADLEQFAKTGKLPDNLQLFSSILTPQVRELLTRRLQVDPAFADKFFDELNRNPAGKQFVSSLTAAIPGSSIESLQVALNLALRQANGLSPLGFLRAYPEENITVDASQAVSLAVEFNPNYWQSQVFGALLARESFPAKNSNLPKNLDPAAIGKETIQQQTFILQDQQRNRSIPVDIYWGGSNAQDPLVVISPGFGANRRFFSYLARHLASHGLTVAAIEHPDSNVAAVARANNKASLAKLLPASEFVNRPKDISFLLNELTKFNIQPGSLQGKLNTDKVTVIGHSLGGYTALALVGGEIDLPQLRQFCQNSLTIGEAPGDWLQCAAAALPGKKLRLKDERVNSAIALNPLVGNLFGKNGLTQVSKPVLILTGTEDALTPALKHQIAPFSQLQGEKYLLSAIGGTHLSISDPRYLGSNANTIVRERRGEETKALRQLLQGVSLAFVKQLTPEAKSYQQFLTPAYAQSLSTSQLPLSLVSELPANLKSWLKLVER